MMAMSSQFIPIPSGQSREQRDEAATKLQRAFRQYRQGPTGTVGSREEHPELRKEFVSGKTLWERSWLMYIIARLLMYNVKRVYGGTPTGAQRKNQMRTYALMRHLFLILTVIISEILDNPLGSFLSNEINTVRGNFLDEMRMPANVVGDRLSSGLNDFLILGPVMNSDDVVHMLNVAQRFCKETGGGGGHGAESHLCDMRTVVTPSPPMFYKYDKDGDPPEKYGNEKSGWEEALSFEKRRKSRLLRALDFLKGSPNDKMPANAKDMAKKYPRAEGIKCDSETFRRFENGEDIRLNPFGNLPWGFPETLDMGRYEGPDVAGGLAPNPPFTLNALKEIGLDSISDMAEKQIEVVEAIKNDLKGKGQGKRAVPQQSLLQDSANERSEKFSSGARRATRKHNDRVGRGSAARAEQAKMTHHDRQVRRAATSLAKSAGSAHPHHGHHDHVQSEVGSEVEDTSASQYRDRRLVEKPYPEKNFVASAGDGSDAPINRNYEPWCFVPSRNSVKRRYDWLRDRDLPFTGGNETKRKEAPKLSYGMRDTCRNHHWGLVMACAPEDVTVTLFFKISRITSQLISRQDQQFLDLCQKHKSRAKGTSQVFKCDEEQYLLYEDNFGDMAFREHAFGTLRVTLRFATTGLVSGRPSSYRTQVNMDAMVYRTGNVGGWDVIALCVYFFTLVVAFKGEIGTIVLLPRSLYRVYRHRHIVKRPQDAADMLMDVVDPLEMNRDVFPSLNALLALTAALCRLLFHLLSVRMFFVGHPMYSRDFGRIAPYAYCDLQKGDLQDVAWSNPRASARLGVNPNWEPFYPGMYLAQDGTPIASQFATLSQDLNCPNPRGYTTTTTFQAAAIDLFFLPYDDFVIGVLKDIANLFSLLFFFFITEEYVSWNWVAVTTKRGVNQLRSFFPVYVGILLASTFILKVRFGNYFMQFKTYGRGFLNLASWALGGPKNHLDDDFDLMNDNQSWVLAIYFVAVSCAIVVLAANIFISIIMEAYESARSEEGQNYKWGKMSYFLVKKKKTQMQGLYRYIFPNVKIPFDKKAFLDALNNQKITVLS